MCLASLIQVMSSITSKHEHQFVVFGILHKSMVPLAHLAEREII